MWLANNYANLAHEGRLWKQLEDCVAKLFLKDKWERRIFMSEGFDPRQAASVSSQFDALSIMHCSHIAGVQHMTQKRFISVIP